jgi:benzylsuccinate CoA-transferase BbsF subunit
MTARPPLAGIRIADFSWYAAGPFGTLMLGMLGAEVIRIESHTKRDTHRKEHPIYGRNYVPSFDHLLSRRLSAALNLRTDRGKQIARELVSRSDVVVENFRPGVMARLGLDYPTLSRGQPDLVMVSLSANGQTGPDAGRPGYAPLFSALSGLSSLGGYPDGPPVEMRNAMDHVCGLFAAFAVLAALRQRQATGRGQYVDLANREVASLLAGHAFVERSGFGRVPPRTGDREAGAEPSGVYRCAGEDRWVAVSVRSEPAWQGLCALLERPGWARDPRLRTVAGRADRRAEIDRAVTGWTTGRGPYEAAFALQERGVAAFPVMSGEDLARDPHLWERGSVLTVRDPERGAHLSVGPPWRFGRSTLPEPRWSPAIGQDNRYVYGKVLGMSDEEITELERSEVLY